MRKRRELPAFANAKRRTGGDHAAVADSLIFPCTDADALSDPNPWHGPAEIDDATCCTARCHQVLSAHQYREVLQAWSVLPHG